MLLRTLRSQKDILDTVLEIGFLPFFENRIRGFSIEEAIAPELWFAKDTDGPWEWKGPLAETRKVAYGKFFSGKAGFISLEYFRDFLNFRRDGYDFDARFDDGLASLKDKGVYDTVYAEDSILSKTLKEKAGYGKGGKTGFETVITRLQMQTYITVDTFRYMLDKKGNPYGWGVAVYSTPEALFGEDFVRDAYRESPERSGEKILSHMRKILPASICTDPDIEKLFLRM